MHRLIGRVLVVVSVSGWISLAAAPAPAPTLLTPGDTATGVGLDVSLTWIWRDELIVNGSFGAALTNGWDVRSTTPYYWRRVVEPPNAGLAEADLTFARQGATTLSQVVTMPPDTTTAAVGWLEYVSPPTGPVRPGTPTPGLRVDITDDQTVLETLHESHGDEPEFQSGAWVARIADLTAYAGQTIHLSFRARGFETVSMFWTRVDGVSLRVERTDLPAFDLYLGTSLPLGPANLVGQVNALNYDLTGLPPNTRQYWQVGAVRDGVTNLSRVFSFTTEQTAPTVTVLSSTATQLTIRFGTRADRTYTVEQTDHLSPPNWVSAFPGTPGTGSPMSVDLPLSPSSQGFYRVRVDP